KDGVIINISSIGGRVTFPLGTLYHGTKFAVEGLTEALSFEMGAIGVRVKIVEPGAIRTDFAGRSFDLNNDQSLAEYQECVTKVLAGFAPMMVNSADPIVVAEVIFQAATDGTKQLRYPAGEDAKAILASRRAADDATFLEGIRARFGLHDLK